MALQLLLPATAKAESEVFPTPDIIKPNVAFWIRIYTEVSLKEGLLHDRDYPQIVYEKSPTGDRAGKTRNEYISGRMQIYSDAIIAVRDSAPDKWGAVEKRVAEMFKGVPKGALDSAEARIRHQTGQRERFKAGVERSAMFLDTISAILKLHGVPDELKYLPHVESSFDTYAYSKAGAAGLWQFMRATGKGYMKIDYMIDERNDPVISSHAAAKFLRANYDLLKTWPLAITAYNHGPNGMRRAAESLGTRDIAIILEKHESASFKFASKNFYACFLAVLQIMEKPENYVKGINYKPKWEATSVRVPAAMTPSALLKSLNITEQEFKLLNPSFRPVAFTQQKAIPEGYAINLPVTIKGDEALAALKQTAPPPQRAAAAPAAVASAPGSSAKAGTGAGAKAPEKAAAREIEPDADGYYTVVQGDNLNSIAKRLGVSMNDLAKVNNITNSSRIYVGQVLFIPDAAAVQVAASTPKPQAPPSTPDTAKTPLPKVSTPSIDTTVVIVPKDTVAIAASKKDTATAAASTAKPETPPSAPVAVLTGPQPEKPKFRELRISVSSTYDTTWTRIVDTAKAVRADTAKQQASSAKITAVDTAKTAAVDTVKSIISTAAALREAEAPPAIPASPAGKPAIDTRFDANVYDLGMTVVPGGSSVQVRVSVDETIGRFSEWMRVSADEIRRHNSMEPGAALPLGRLVSIPITSSTNIKRFEVNRLQHHMAIEEDFFARYNVVGLEAKKVKQGDNLWRICSEAQIPMWLLKKFNRGGARFYDLRIGDNLWIPKTSAKDSTHEVINEFDTNPVVGEGMEE